MTAQTETTKLEKAEEITESEKTLKDLPTWIRNQVVYLPTFNNKTTFNPAEKVIAERFLEKQKERHDNLPISTVAQMISLRVVTYIAVYDARTETEERQNLGFFLHMPHSKNTKEFRKLPKLLQNKEFFPCAPIYEEIFSRSVKEEKKKEKEKELKLPLTAQQRRRRDEIRKRYRELALFHDSQQGAGKRGKKSKTGRRAKKNVKPASIMDFVKTVAHPPSQS